MNANFENVLTKRTHDTPQPFSYICQENYLIFLSFKDNFYSASVASRYYVYKSTYAYYNNEHTVTSFQRHINQM